MLVKLKPEKDPTNGRTMMKEIEGTEYTVKADLVLIAAGFVGAQNYVTTAFGVEKNARGNVSAPEGSHKTNGQSLVVRAIREGRDAAREVDESLMGYTNL